MDERALRAANLLVGNEEGAAGLEATAEGPALLARADLAIAVVGADMGVRVDGRLIPSGTTVAVRRGQLLEMGRARRGLRAYLAVAGGVDVPLLLGSRSTCLPAAFGGFDGRALRAGDRVKIGPAGWPVSALEGRSLPPGWWVAEAETIAVRVVLGPQDERFTPKGIETFFGSAYRILPHMDRMGIRLEGPPIALRAEADIISDSVPLGSIQVPADGQPIILLADRQTTGGYAKIGVVVKEDVSRLAQATPDQWVRFRQVSLAEAHAALRAYEARYRALRHAWQAREARSTYILSMAGKAYQVEVAGTGAIYRVRLRERKGTGGQP
jgi:antagonist of KipI